MNSRFHKVLKLKSTSSSEYSRRIHVLATKKRPENKLKIYRHHTQKLMHLPSPSSTLFGPESFCPTKMNKRFSYYVSKEQLHHFFFLIHHTKLEAIWWWKKYFIHTIFSSLAFKLSVFKAQVMVIATSTLGAQHCCKWGQPICEV